MTTPTKSKAVTELNAVMRLLKTEPSLVITVLITVVTVVSSGLSGHWDLSGIIGAVELAGGLGIRSQVMPTANLTAGVDATVSVPSAPVGGGMGAGTPAAPPVPVAAPPTA